MVDEHESIPYFLRKADDVVKFDQVGDQLCPSIYRLPKQTVILYFSWRRQRSLSEVIKRLYYSGN